MLLSSAAVVAVVVAACGSDEPDTLATLPPIRTTTTSTTTTVLEDQFTRLYTVKAGDNLSRIAASFDVPLTFLIEANEDIIDDPSNVPPGLTLKIPPFVIVDELPTTPTEAP